MPLDQLTILLSIKIQLIQLITRRFSNIEMCDEGQVEVSPISYTYILKWSKLHSPPLKDA